MSIRLALDDNDFDMLEKKTGSDFSEMREQASKGRYKAVRFSTLEFYCRVLDRRPGDILELVDDGWSLSSSNHDLESEQRPTNWRVYATVAAAFVLIALVLLFHAAFRIS